ncbi:magnesium transporter [Mangrovicoccus sp. HB161399]|uniref:magnesium transporter n=1 Tax=Mangrovicoccus sp. HB161399 TaxID=2720392 RepID=UPI001557AF8F|nr:magnesium transporter [Mangrovicoccus sp. HB161399]
MTENQTRREPPETEEEAALREEEEADHEIDEDSHSEGERRFGRVQAALADEDVERLNEYLDPMHSADIADLLEQVSGSERQQILALVPEQIDGEVLSELDEGIREEVIETLAPEALAEAVRDLDTDDVVDLVEFLEEDRQEAILEALDATDRVAVQMALTYPEYSAGRLMQREFVVAPGDWTVGHAIDFLRSAEELPEQFYHVILVDPAMRPVAYVTLGRLLASKRDVRLGDITEETFRTIAVDLPEKDVAYAFNQYHLISAPVVDDSGRLVGVITIDDAMIVLEEEAEEDILRLAGVSDESSISDGVVDTVKSRLPWLLVNLVTAIVASMVISLFEASLAQLVALAVLMPIIASMGGNAGTQSLTVAVRALATKDLTRSNLMRVIRREGAVGLVHGLVFAVVMSGIELLWFGNAALAGVIAMAMVINLFVAGLSGILVPVALDRLKLDPALASGTFVTTVTDVVGFFAFLGLATLVLL